MLSDIEKLQKMDPDELKALHDGQIDRLGQLQQSIRQMKIPVIIMLDGWDAAGKGSMTGDIIRALDPRGFKVYTLDCDDEAEERYPYMHRYWKCVPLYGNISVLDGGWYRGVFDPDNQPRGNALSRRITQIKDFEKQLTDDGYVVLKFFLHIGKKEQKRRFDALEEKSDTRWRVTRDDLKQNREYDDWLKSYDDMMALTDTDNAPWHVVHSGDRRLATARVYDIIIDAIEKALKAHEGVPVAETQADMKALSQAEAETTDEADATEQATAETEAAETQPVDLFEDADEQADAQGDAPNDEQPAQTDVPAEEQAAPEEQSDAQPDAPKERDELSPGDFDVIALPRISDVSLGFAMGDDEYHRELKRAQRRLKELHGELYQRRIPVVLGFEGWDAAGKGGAIKRLTRALDPRGYEVIPTAAPTPDELHHQYLWRFWRDLPKDGHIAIFDRTWYGRVMVERIEGFASREQWQRAYAEINQFERSLTEWGAIVMKFWLQIDKDEQLSRFTARQNTPDKRWKITDEDWRNRDRWPEYEQSVDDMLALTNTHDAPWIIVESNDKQYARLKVMNAVIKAVEKRL